MAIKYNMTNGHKIWQMALNMANGRNIHQMNTKYAIARLSKITQICTFGLKISHLATLIQKCFALLANAVPMFLQLISEHVATLRQCDQIERIFALRATVYFRHFFKIKPKSFGLLFRGA
jgi:hypothetical protein